MKGDSNMALRVETYKNGTDCEQKLIGRLDTTTAQDAQNQMLQAAEDAGNFILNFEELEYISSAGLRAVKMLRTAMKKKGGNVRIKGANPDVMEVFDVTGFVNLFEFD
jgi:anti-sigma B factor antagonist